MSAETPAERNIRAHAFNAVTAALAEDDRWLPLTARSLIAAAVVAASEPHIRADERERIRLLAERHAATYAECGGCCDPEDNPDHRIPFADLIGGTT